MIKKSILLLYSCIFCLLLSVSLTFSFKGERVIKSEFDILIRNGSIVDGAGNPWFKADIGIRDGKILKVGNLASSTGKKIIDARGLVVSPGFIDIHNHSDSALLINPKAESMIRQGVTTMLIGNCGKSASPSEKWQTLNKYFAQLDKQGVATNVAALVGHGDIRTMVLGEASRLPTSKELKEMKALVAQAMEDGAIGMSTGLDYAPGMFSDTNEIIELCKVVAKYGGIYTTHIRSGGPTWGKAVWEAIEIAEKSGVPLQISHLESHYGNWGNEEKILKILEEARARGRDVKTDIPPYLCGGTGIFTMLPVWAHEGGTPKILERLRDPVEREKIKEWILKKKTPTATSTMITDGLPDKIWIGASQKNPNYVGKNLAQIAELRGKDPLDVAFDLIIEEGKNISMVIEHHFEDDMRILIKHPLSMIVSDGSALAPYGPLGEGKPNPRSYGTFPLVIRKYVRGETRKEEPTEVGVKLLSLQEAVRKITSFPAQKLGLKDRGMLREDMWADIVIFDPQTIEDQATYVNPHQYPKGIPYVLVNGQIVIENGEHTGILPGKILRGKGYRLK